MKRIECIECKDEHCQPFCHQAQLESCEEEHKKVVEEIFEDIGKLWLLPDKLKQKYEVK